MNKSKWLSMTLLLTMIVSLWSTTAVAAEAVFGSATTTAAPTAADYIEVEAAPVDITINIEGPRKQINAVDKDVSGITDYVALFTTEYAPQITVGKTSVGVVVDGANQVTRVVNPSVNGGVPVWTGPTDLVIPQGGYILVSNDDSWANKTYKQYLAKNFKVGDKIKLRKNGEVIPVSDLMTGQGLKARLKLNNDEWFTVTEPKTVVSGKLENLEQGIPYSIRVNQSSVALQANGTFQIEVGLTEGVNYLDVIAIKNGTENDRKTLVVFYKKQNGTAKEVVLWVDQGTNIFKLQTPENVHDMLTKAKDAGVTAIALDVKGVEGFANYKKNDLTGRPHISQMNAPTRAGANPNLDMLEEFIRYGHQLGIKIHAAFNVFAEGSPAHNEYGLLNQHLDWEEHVYRPEDGGQILRLRESNYYKTGKSLVAFVNPANDDVRAFELKNMEEVIKNYDVDGVVLDRTRYDNETADFSPLTRSKFEAFLAVRGKQLTNWPADVFTYVNNVRQFGPLINDWWEFRSQTIKTFTDEVRSLTNRYTALKGHKIYSSAYVGSWFESYYLNGVHWGSPNFKYDSRLQFPDDSLYTESYAQTGYTGNIDFLMIGTYQTTQKEIEHHITLGNIVTNGEVPMYASIALANIQDPPLQRSVFQAGLSQSNGLMLFDYSQVNWSVVKASLQNVEYVKDYQVGSSVPGNQESFLEGDLYNVSRNENNLNVYTDTFGQTTATSTFGVEAIVDSTGKVTKVVNQQQALSWNWTNMSPNNSVIPQGGFVISALDASGVRTRRQLVAKTYKVGDAVRSAVLRGHLAYANTSTPLKNLEIKGNIEVLGPGTADVRLNGVPAALASNGDFSGNVSLEVGANPVKISVYVDGRKTNEKTVTITRTAPVITGIELDSAAYRLVAGDKHATVATAVYSDETRAVISGAVFSSSNPEVAAVAAVGTVTALKAGTAEISAVYEGKTAKSVVTVVELASLSFDENKHSLVKGETFNAPLKATYSDGTMAYITQGATFISSLDKVASIAADGTITAVKPGSATITVSYRGKQSEIKIKVFNTHIEKIEDKENDDGVYDDAANDNRENEVGDMG
ncbi:family 10 glycosylhydrolase [Paenibacillus sp. LMG 31458]|uniref:Family 10 glycosylhydrolase n=1 Tax=Paenibacillus phytorum TaxID=2654977 RepID=A0ABX1XZV5_9BACL|nr:family 10 glycosylhydrolase [Paenibacillus phytorum]NOU74117.1 family 10 glycosylhydrolase [Paenibacillus phytorum]